MNDKATQPTQTKKTHSKASGGGVPAGWQEVKLEEIGNIVTGKTPSKKNPEDWGNDFDFITPTDIVGDSKYLTNVSRQISKTGSDRFSQLLIPPNTVIVTCIGSDMGKVVLNKRTALTNQQINSLIVSKKVHHHFAYYALKNKHKVLRQHAESGGSTMPILNKTNFSNLKILLPPLPEQKAIAEVLSSLDDKIDLLHRQNKTLEDTAQALFRKWFVDEADEGWEEKRIGEVLDTKLGGTPSTTKPEYWNGDIPWINSGEINKFRIFEPTKYITQLGLEKSATKLLPKGTTVIAITGATLGQISLLEFDCCANQSVVGVIPNKILPREFVYLWIKKTIAELISNQTGGAQQHINKNDVNNAIIIIPAKEKLEKNIPILKNLFDKISVNISQIRTLENLRDTLLSKLMSGEVRVKDFTK